jgi:5'-deoxynucleotidase YfbR-like HD superfamily hydrolase
VKGLQTIVAALPSHLGKEIFDLFMEYETGTSSEAIQLKDIDVFEMILQAFEYEKGGVAPVSTNLTPPQLKASPWKISSAALRASSRLLRCG